MANKEMDELVRAVLGREHSVDTVQPRGADNGSGQVEQVVRHVLTNERLTSTTTDRFSTEVREVPSRTFSSEVDRLAGQLDQLRQASVSQAENLRENTSALSNARQGSGSMTAGSGVGSTVMKTVGTALGISPIITGLTKLFGLFNKPEPLPQLSPLVMPRPLRVEAGLEAKTQELVPISYTAQGQVRSAEPRTAMTAPSIQIQVNALDSKSFMDHSDEIARAVKEAMLNSHSLNDVVNEL
jgi:hypothetical protein